MPAPSRDVVAKASMHVSYVPGRRRAVTLGSAFRPWIVRSNRRARNRSAGAYGIHIAVFRVTVSVSVPGMDSSAFPR